VKKFITLLLIAIDIVLLVSVVIVAVECNQIHKELKQNTAERREHILEQCRSSAQYNTKEFQ